MRSAHCLLLLSVLLLGATASWAAAPAPVQEKIFEAKQGGYDTYRIPALLRTQKDTLLAFCEGRKKSGSDAGDIDLLLRRSTDNGATWNAVQVLVNDGENTCGNPCPILDRATGTVVLLFTKNIGSETEAQIMRGTAAPRTAWLTLSHDDGLTWSTPADISAQVRKPEWRWYATGPCHGIQLASGRLVAPCDHSTGPAPEEIHSHVIFSDDGGASWNIGGVLDGRTDECTVLELADGTLYLNMRNNRGTGHRAYALSRDAGLTWSAVAEDTALIEPVCQASLLRLSTEKEQGTNRVLFANPASKRRENLTLRLSTDECATWPTEKLLWPGPAAYSDLVLGKDGMIGCLYECGEKKPYETITFARFPLEWITGPPAK